MPPRARHKAAPGRSRYGLRAAVLLALLGLSGCAVEPGNGKQNADSAALYSQLHYWPTQEAGFDDGQVCAPVSLIGPDTDSYGLGELQQTDLWQRVRAGYSLEGSVDEQRIERQIDVYSDKQRFFDQLGPRASWYLYYVVEQLDQRNMPLELALLPIMESAYNPQALSRSRAAGMWQIIPSTGTNLGLEQNGWYDGRKDLIASTDAALDYLSDLHQRFDGDWYLALAAYNAGEGSVQRAIDRNRRQGKPTDYWSLPLSRQACNYVPRLIALSRILEAPADHGVRISPIANEPSLVPIEVDQQVNLRSAATLAGFDSEEFFNLNAAFKRGYTLPNTSNTVLVPASEEAEFLSILSEMPRAHTASGQRYRVRSGDNLGAIARLHKTSVEQLRAVNGLSDDRLSIGQELLLPGDAVLPQRQYPTATTVALKTQGTYVVRPGDSLWRIARKFETTTSELARRNSLPANATLRVGQRLQVRDAAPELGAATGSRQRIDYRVRDGDSLHRIAGRFKVPLGQLMEWNRIDAGRPLIKPGQSLVLWVEDPELASASTI